MSNQASGGGFFVTLATFLLAITLSQFPLDSSLQWFRPDFILLVLFFWLIWAPNRVGLVYAFFIGLLLDLMRGSVLGLGAFSLTLIAFITQLLHSRLRVFPMLQQSFVLLLLVGLNQLIYYWMQGLVGNSADTLLFLLPALTSALLWPLVFITLRRLARSLDLN